MGGVDILVNGRILSPEQLERTVAQYDLQDGQEVQVNSRGVLVNIRHVGDDAGDPFQIDVIRWRIHFKLTFQQLWNDLCSPTGPLRDLFYEGSDDAQFTSVSVPLNELKKNFQNKNLKFRVYSEIIGSKFKFFLDYRNSKNSNFS